MFVIQVPAGGLKQGLKKVNTAIKAEKWAGVNRCQGTRFKKAAY